MTQSTKSCLSSTGEDFAHNVTQDVDGAVRFEGLGGFGLPVSQVKIPSGTGAGFDDGKERGVALNCNEPDGGVGMRGTIVEQLG